MNITIQSYENQKKNQEVSKTNNCYDVNKKEKEISKSLVYASISITMPRECVTKKKQETNYAVIDVNATEALKKTKESIQFDRNARSIFTKELIAVVHTPKIIINKHAGIWKSKIHLNTNCFSNESPKLVFARGVVLNDIQKGLSKERAMQARRTPRNGPKTILMR